MIKSLLPAFRIVIFFSLLTGGAYTYVFTGIGQLVWHDRVEGGFVVRDGHEVGATLIAQKFVSSRYFWARPSAIDYNPLPSGGSNLSRDSATLKTQVVERQQTLMATHPEHLQPPSDLVTTSGSGLDPHISPEAALFQVSRVAQARGLKIQQVTQLVRAASESRQWGVFGEPRVNVLVLNLSLDRLPTVPSGG